MMQEAYHGALYCLQYIDNLCHLPVLGNKNTALSSYPWYLYRLVHHLPIGYDCGQYYNVVVVADNGVSPDPIAVAVSVAELRCPVK